MIVCRLCRICQNFKNIFLITLQNECLRNIPENCFVLWKEGRNGPNSDNQHYCNRFCHGICMTNSLIWSRCMEHSQYKYTDVQQQVLYLQLLTDSWHSHMFDISSPRWLYYFYYKSILGQNKYSDNYTSPNLCHTICFPCVNVDIIGDEARRRGINR